MTSLKKDSVSIPADLVKAAVHPKNTPYVSNDLSVTLNIDAEIMISEAGIDQTQLQVCLKPQEEARPVLTLRWSLPLVDIQYEWYPMCGKDRSLHVVWNDEVTTRIASGAPLFCFLNAAGRSRFTLALSDALSEIDITIGVREEDATLSCEVSVPLNSYKKNEYSLTLYRNYEDAPFADAIRKAVKWWETECKMTPMPVPEAARLPLYSTWYSFHQATVAHEIEEECRLAAQMGFKSVIVDDGWQTGDGNRGYGYCGDWRPCFEKIPDMAAHVQRIHEMGMKYMLWYSVPFVGEWSENWEVFKDMILKHDVYHHAGILDPRYKLVRSYLISTYANALRDWNLDGFKLDFIDSFPASAHACAPNKDMDIPTVEDAVLCLMTDIMNTLREIKPDIMIEFRQSYIGPAMRTFGNMLRVGDCPADALTNRVGVVDLRLMSGNTAVHSDMLMWHPADSVENAARQILNVLFGVIQLSMRIENLPEDHKKMVAFWTGFMTAHRALLNLPLEVEAPESLYPIVRVCNGEEELIAVYESRAVHLSIVHKTYLINVTCEEEVIIKLPHSKNLCITTFRCTGDKEKEYTLSDVLLYEMTIPVCGYAVIEELIL